MSLQPRRPSKSTQRFRNTWQSDDQLRLEHGLQQLGIELPAAQLQQLNQWAALLLQWNHTYNLLGSNDTRTLVDEHLLDSLAILPALGRHLQDPLAPLADIGSGAGFPGILLAIAQPQRPLILVEPVGKKAAFLRQSALTLDLKNVRVFAQRIETLTQQDLGGPDPNFICRAFTALGRFASLCEPFMSEHSLAFAMKAVKLAEEQLGLPPSISLQAVETIHSTLPDTQRFLAVLKRSFSPPVVAPAPSSEPTDNRRLA